ncbi:hypothetical protein D3C85_1660990 [compost metagenome]
MGAVEEELDLEALADQAPLHIDHAGQDRIDGAGFGVLAQLGQCEGGSHPQISACVAAAAACCSCAGYR